MYVGTVEGTNEKIDVTPFAYNDFTGNNRMIAFAIQNILDSGKNIIIDSGSQYQIEFKYGNLSANSLIIPQQGKPFSNRMMGYSFDGDIVTLFIPGNKQSNSLAEGEPEEVRAGFEVIPD